MNMLPRRGLHQFTVVLLLALSAALLTACGFHMRGSAKYPFTSIYVQPPVEGVPIVPDVIIGLRNAGIDVKGKAADAELVAHITQIAFDKRVLSLSGSGRAREFELEYLIRYELTDSQGRSWGESGEIMLRRDFSYAESQTLAKEIEEQQLIRDMQRDASAQILRRLYAVKRPQ